MRGVAELQVLYGELALSTLHLPSSGEREAQSVSVGGKAIAYEQHECEIRFREPVSIGRGESLIVRFG